MLNDWKKEIKSKKLLKAVEALCEELKKIWEWKAGDEWEPYVYFWSIGKWGLRVAEFGMHASNSGSAYMQSEPTHAEAIFAVERWLLEQVYAIGDDMEDLTWRLHEALKKET